MNRALSDDQKARIAKRLALDAQWEAALAAQPTLNPRLASCSRTSAEQAFMLLGKAISEGLPEAVALTVEQQAAADAARAPPALAPLTEEQLVQLDAVQKAYAGVRAALADLGKIKGIDGQAVSVATTLAEQSELWAKRGVSLTALAGDKPAAAALLAEHAQIMGAIEDMGPAINVPGAGRLAALARKELKSAAWFAVASV